MRNFKLVIEYDGTDFHGWQRQPKLRTVQGLLEDAVADLFGKSVQINGAGRTDAGVHAFGQVANVVLDTTLTPEKLGKAIASKLPEDVQVYLVQEVDLPFHARFSAKSRRYNYFLRTEPTAIWRRFAHVITVPLDVAAMRSAVELLLGEKDFASFAPVRAMDTPTVCRMLKADIEEHDEVLAIILEADHFLHHMVRAIVGTLIEVGRGKIPSEQIEEILCTKDRARAGPTIPPNGLFLMEVKYDG